MGSPATLTTRPNISFPTGTSIEDPSAVARAFRGTLLVEARAIHLATWFPCAPRPRGRPAARRTCGFRRSRGWREVHSKARTSPPRWAPEWTRPFRPGSPGRVHGVASSSDHAGVRFPNAGVGDLVQAPEILQGLFLFRLGQLQEARLQVHGPGP